MLKVINILKILGILTGALVTVWSVFEMYDTFNDNQKKQLENDVIMINKINDLAYDTDSMKNVLNDVRTGQYELKSSFAFYRKNVDKIDKKQMEQIILDAYGLGYEIGKKKELTPLM